MIERVSIKFLFVLSWLSKHWRNGWKTGILWLLANNIISSNFADWIKNLNGLYVAVSCSLPRLDLHSTDKRSAERRTCEGPLLLRVTCRQVVLISSVAVQSKTLLDGDYGWTQSNVHVFRLLWWVVLKSLHFCFNLPALGRTAISQSSSCVLYQSVHTATGCNSYNSVIISVLCAV